MDPSMPITRAEHEEFRRRLEEENKRQNRRIELLEENTKQLSSLTVSVEKLAQSVHQMCKQQEQQGERLEMLESRDGKRWQHMCSYAATAVVSVIVGLILSQLGVAFSLF